MTIQIFIFLVFLPIAHNIEDLNEIIQSSGFNKNDYILWLRAPPKCSLTLNGVTATENIVVDPFKKNMVLYNKNVKEKMDAEITITLDNKQAKGKFKGISLFSKNICIVSIDLFANNEKKVYFHINDESYALNYDIIKK